MFVYEKKLQYPVRIKNTNPKLAALIISQYGGPDGELGASLRYLSQRYSMPWPELKGLLTDIGTVESKCGKQAVQEEGPFLGQQVKLDFDSPVLIDHHTIQNIFIKHVAGLSIVHNLSLIHI